VFLLASCFGCFLTSILPAQGALSSVLGDQFAEWVGGSRVRLDAEDARVDRSSLSQTGSLSRAIGFQSESSQLA